MQPQNKSSVVVGLLWHSMASGNLGVIALTLAQIAIVRDAAGKAGVDVQIKIFGWKLDGSVPTPPAYVGIDYIGLDARSLLDPRSRFHKELGTCQLVLDVGEGDSFSDIYGLKRLLYLCVSKRFAGADGRHLVLSPQTIGPFSTPLSRWMARFAVKGAKRVFARDPLSKDWLDENGIGEKSAEAIDMAFRLPFTRDDSPRMGVKIGINVSGLLYAGGYGRNNGLGLTVDYAALTHLIIEWALGLPDAEVWLVPHVMSRDIPEEDDVHVSRNLASQYPALRIAGPFNDPCDAKSFMSGLDFFSGGRMHACIGAFSAGVPTVPLAYSRKFNGLFAALNYKVLADCRLMTTDAAFRIVCDAYANREQHAKSVGGGIQVALEKLRCYEHFIADALRGVAVRA